VIHRHQTVTVPAGWDVVTIPTAPVSVIVPSFGPPGSHYAAFVPRWWEAIRRMSPQPAEVVVVHTDPEPLGILAAAPAGMAVRSVVVPGGTSMAEMVNAGVRAASQPWCCGVGVDDMLTPDAFVYLERADDLHAEIMLWNHAEENGTVREGSWRPYRLLRENTVHGSCPFTVGLWRAVGGFPDVAWSDWGFWLRCAAYGARAWKTHHVGVVWDTGEGRPTMTSQANDQAVAEARRQEIHELIRGLIG